TPPSQPGQRAQATTPFGQTNTPFGRIPTPAGQRGPRPEETPEIRVQREALRVLFEANADRAIEIATDRLKADPTDAVALGNLYMVAQSRSEKALPMLVTLARTSPDSKTRNE